MLSLATTLHSKQRRPKRARDPMTSTSHKRIRSGQSAKSVVPHQWCNADVWSHHAKKSNRISSQQIRMSDDNQSERAIPTTLNDFQCRVLKNELCAHAPHCRYLKEAVHTQRFALSGSPCTQIISATLKTVRKQIKMSTIQNMQ